MLRCVTGLGVCMLAVSLVATGGCSKGKDGGNGGGPSAKYETPEAAFTALKTSVKKDDWTTAMGTMTLETQDMMAGGMAASGMMMKQFAKFSKGDDSKKIAKIEKVLQKHGLTEEQFKLLTMDAKDMKQDPSAFMAKLTAPIKNKPAFVGEMIDALGKKSDDMKELGDSTLKDVKITGDTAKGTVITLKNDKEKSTPIEFKKQEDSWRIDMTHMMNKEPPPGPELGK